MQLIFSQKWFRAWRGWALALLLLGAGPARATHIVGGEMELVHQNGENYLLVLNLYFDAVNGSAGALDNDLTASIFEKNGNTRMTDVLLPLVSNTFVNYTNPTCAIGSLSTRRLVYSAPVVLPAATYASPGGYYAAVERCCRNNTIANIVRPSEAAQAFYLEFPAVVRNGRPFYDSTPRIFPPLADYACRNELFYYDFGGVDADGDSLIYDLVTPLNGHAEADPLGQYGPKPPRAAPAPYVPVIWGPGRSVSNQIPGSPTLGVNRFTGRLTVRPTSIGLFVFGVRCAEYRRGVKIGEARRDFQMLTLNCAGNNPPNAVLLPSTTSHIPYRPGRDTLRLRPGGDRCIRLKFTDPDPASQLTVSLSPVNFTQNLPTFTTATTGQVRAPGVPDTLVATLCFPSCLDSHGKVLLLDLVVADDGCSLPRRDTLRVALLATPPPNLPPTLTTTAAPLPLHVHLGDLVTFGVTGTDPENDPLTLTMTGQGFDPAALGATFAQTAVGTQQQGQFAWRVTCAALDPPLHEFRFVATATGCASGPQQAGLTVPVVVDYANAPAGLTTTLPPPLPNDGVPLVRLPLGQVYTATLTGTDPDGDPLALEATGRGFDLSAAGMHFAAQNGPGAASATFGWEASCQTVHLGQSLTVDFQLRETNCHPATQARTVRFEVVSPDTVAVQQYNVITPNGDGLNDAFELPTLPPNFCDSQFAEVVIFSRWGQRVFQADRREFKWRGAGSSGLYFYLVTYTDGRRFKGWLEVRP